MTSRCACTKALGYTLQSLDGKLGSECVPELKRAIDHMNDSENKVDYMRMNPKNGWGDYESALNYLKDILIACELHPKAQLSISC
jgi:hypothetical protein